MTRMIVDSSAWMEYFDGTRAGEKVKRFLEDEDTFTHSVTMSEVMSKLRRKGRDTEDARQAFAALPKVIDTDRGSSVRAGELHAEVRHKVPNFSLADAYVLEAAQRLGLKVLTGDPDFKGLEEAEFLG